MALSIHWMLSTDSVHRDMIDVRYQMILGITSIILTALEENRIEWSDLDEINTMQKHSKLNICELATQRCGTAS